MKMNLRIIAATLGAGFALGTVTTNANAYDHLTIGPWKSWGGAYFGTYFGAGNGNADQSFHDRDYFKEVETSQSDFQFIFASNSVGSGHLHGSITGSKADLFVGYNFHEECATYLLGAQLEGTYFSDISFKEVGTRHSTDSFGTLNINPDGEPTSTSITRITGKETEEFSDELRSMFSLVGRAGYLATPSTLVYLLLGATEGNFVVPDSSNPFGGKRNKWELGYTAGVGVEYMLNDNWSLRAEYRYLHFNVDRSQSEFDNEVETSDDSVDVTTESFHRSSSTDFDFNVGQIGIVYRFPC